MKSRKVAITGGIATGKSTILAALRADGFRVASADEVSREILREKEVRDRVAELSSLEKNWKAADLLKVLGESQPIRKKVNGYLHPLIWNNVSSLEADFVEIPLLFELGLQFAFIEVWCAYCEREVQLQRVAERYGSGPENLKLIDSQMDLRAKAYLSDWVIRTDQPVETVCAVALFRAALIATSES